VSECVSEWWRDVPGVFQSRNGQAARWETSDLLARGAGRVNTGGWEGGRLRAYSCGCEAGRGGGRGGVEFCVVSCEGVRPE
jgi:hypothetical protein